MQQNVWSIIGHCQTQDTEILELILNNSSNILYFWAKHLCQTPFVYNFGFSCHINFGSNLARKHTPKVEPMLNPNFNLIQQHSCSSKAKKDILFLAMTSFCEVICIYIN